MIILKNGDVMLFECKACGCRFVEAVNKTRLKNCGVWDPEKQDHGTWMDCPHCGESVLGFRTNKETQPEEGIKEGSCKNED